MRLKDTFLTAPAAVAQAEPKADRKALRALGAEQHAKAGLTSGGAAFKTGDDVTYTTPDGVQRCGAVVQAGKNPDEWVVQLDPTTYNLVPTHELRRAVPARAAVKALLSPKSQLRETRNAVDLGDGIASLMFDYGHAALPSDDDVLNYVAAKYGYQGRIIDADDSKHGKLIVRVSSKVEAPGLNTEEIEGTGKIGGDESGPTQAEQDALVHAATKSVGFLAGRNPEYQFDVTSTELYAKPDGRVACRATFVLLSRDGDNRFFEGHRVTAVLSDSAAPATGYVEVVAGMDGFVAKAFTVAGETPLATVGLVTTAAPYDAGDGPLSTHEDEPAGFENGSYVIKAEDLGGIVTEADIDADGARIPLQQIDYRREKQRYDEQRGDQAKDDAAAADAKAKERRKLLMKERQMEIKPELPDFTAGASPATDEEDGDVREVLVPQGNPDFKAPAQPMGVAAADSTTEEYYADYYGDEYGEAMTAEPARRTHEAAPKWLGPAALSLGLSMAPGTMPDANAAAPVPEAFKNDPRKAQFFEKGYEMGPGPAAQAELKKIFNDQVARRAFQQGVAAKAQLAKKGQVQTGTPVTQVVSGLASLAESRPDVAEKLGKIVGQYLTSGGNLVSALKRVDSTNVLLPKLIYAALSDPIAGKALGQLYGANKENMPVGAMPANPMATSEQPPGPLKPAEFAGGPNQLGDLRGDSPSATFGPSADPFVSGASKQAAGPSVTMSTVSKALVLDSLVRKGDYLQAKVVWDPEDLATLGAANLRHYVISFIKGAASKKEYIDFGTIGKPRFIAFDPDAGYAEVSFRTSESRIAPPVQVPGEAGYHEPNK